MEPSFIRVNFDGREYGIAVTSDGKRIGVCAGGVGKLKYMPVVFSWNSGAYVLPILRKTRLSMVGTAFDLCDSIYTCFRSQNRTQQCVILCEHILKHGHALR